MSGPSTYVPGSGIERWLDERLPIARLMHDSFGDFPTPRNLNYWWTFGGILTTMMVLQIITGIVLVMHFTPHVDFAFDAVEHIRRDVNYGNIIQPSHAVGASMLLALLGVIGGIWAQKFDHIAAVTNFVITPLAFLSGTFYTVDRLPEGFWWAAHFNPFFYMIDGFRYGFIGESDGTLMIGLAVMVVANLALWALVLRMLTTGYRLKA